MTVFIAKYASKARVKVLMAGKTLLLLNMRSSLLKAGRARLLTKYERIPSQSTAGSSEFHRRG